MAKRRRILAEPVPATVCEQNTIPQLLLQRDLGLRSSNVSLLRSFLEVSMKSVQLKASHDAHDEASTSGMALSYMQRRSPVLEVVTHAGLLFVLVNSGLCSVFDTEVHPARRLYYLNCGPHDIIRTIVLNIQRPDATASEASILAVSCHTTDVAFPSQLHCRAVPADRRMFLSTCRSSLYCTAGRPICDSVIYPGFVEFDEVARRALVLNSLSMQYKVYDLSSPSYSLLYCLPAGGITDVKMNGSYLIQVREVQQQQQRPLTLAETEHPETQQQQQQQQPSTSSVEQVQQPEGQQQQQVQEEEKEQEVELQDEAALALTTADGEVSKHQPAAQRVLPIDVMSAVNGQLLARHTLPVLQPLLTYFEVLELFDSHLLVKQPMQPLRIYKVLDLSLCGCSAAEALSQVSSFMYLEQRDLFMTVSYHTLTTWNFRAEVVAQFDDHELWYPGSTDGPLVYVTQDWVVSYCRPKGSHTMLPAAGAVGAIHISNVLNGKLVAKIEDCSRPSEDDADMQQRLLLLPACQQQQDAAASDQTTRMALTDVTAVVYDEDNHTIYTGNQNGMVHQWAPG